MQHKSSRNDMAPGEIIRFRRLEKAFLARCYQFGYQEIKTSTIEPLYIFTALGGLSEAKLRRMYSFIDWDGWSGERVALKPDSTTCVARFYGDHLRHKDVRQKLCYVENHFEWADTWDEISERWQFGVENIGSPNAEADVEVIYTALDILQDAVDRPVYLFLSYPAIIQKMIRLLGFEKEEEQKLIQTIRDNQTEEVDQILAKAGHRRNTVRELKLLIHADSDPERFSANYLKNLAGLFRPSTYEKVQPAFDNFIAICDKLDQLKCQYAIDFSMIGDLQYYTGIQFQILSKSIRKSRKDILCSGGRYDNLIGNMWDLEKPVPAVGHALFVRNILPHMDLDANHLQNIAVFIESINDQDVKTSQILCEKLSELGFDAKISFTPISPEDYPSYGLVIEVNNEKHPDGFQVLFSQKIGKPLLMNLFGGLNGK